jgi:hypothetical protein
VTGSEGKVSFLQQISTEKSVWDFQFDQMSGDLIVLLFSNQDYFRRFKVSASEVSEISVQSPIQTKNVLDRFFEGIAHWFFTIATLKNKCHFSLLCNAIEVDYSLSSFC